MSSNRSFAVKMTSIIAASTLFLAGCASDGENSGDKSSSSAQTVDALKFTYNKVAYEDLKDGGEIVTALAELSEQQNRFHADGTSYTTDIWRWYNPQMIYFTPEGEPVANPEYIESMDSELVDGNTVVTYKLNKKAKFNDDTPIDVTAFQTTWEINRADTEDYTPNATDGYELITSVEPGADNYEVKVTFDGPYLYWPGLFNEIAHPALKDPENYNGYLKQLHPEWGAGPYTVDFVDFNKGEVGFKRNDKWWGRPGKLDRRIYRFMEAKAAVNAFKNGEIDGVGAGTKDSYAAIQGMDNIYISEGPDVANNILTLNAKSENLQDIKVREAVVRAINRDTIVDIAFNTLPLKGEPSGSLFNFPFQEGYHDNFTKVGGFDAEKSKKLLEEAGWVEGADGIREKDGKKLTLNYIVFSDSEVIRAMASAVQKMLKDVGIDAQIDSRPGSDFSGTLSRRDFDLLPMGWSATDPYGVAYFGQSYLSDSEFNKSGTGTPELDAKIREMQAMTDPEAQNKRANELEEEAFAQYGIMPYYNRVVISAQKEGLANMGATGFASFPKEELGWAK
ncbi:ABC transporter substrate-binding protein [Corynebacterium sp. 13CS0277]|uniref:ABC transporter family substrate-binding protein n=1 Tax=Corynebacterium sp. 13CS0277 TaxID=2071994 RepID=UPI000D046D93|nr:ABC transporter family substrate-binding protein [Corynebacterium sp. 13CS0277]PRQ12555.1 ABC transporter substrate-binding protein [Corynebacterium sp. 13CS0277]